MPSSVRRWALLGGLLGVGVVVLLAGGALLRESPTVAGENGQWFLTYAYLLGTPVSLLVEAPVRALSAGLPSGLAAYALAALPVPLNWALIGGALGWLATVFRTNRTAGPV